jgi:uncharacterized FAD-dependent dehydrogenase
MGYKEVDIRIPVNISDVELKHFIGNKANLNHFSFHIILKSLDARNKKNICWQYRIGLQSDEIFGGEIPSYKSIEIPRKKYTQKAVVVGSGPAGIFSALVMALAGMSVTLIERGSQVHERKSKILEFEKNANFSESNNYAFGEGGAGTFSDGKLTSRTKSISLERNFIFKTFVEAGAPEEIIYMTHPHLGSDNLFSITQNLRQRFLDSGGEILFNTTFTDIQIQGNIVTSVITTKGSLQADFFVIAPGHSAFETYRMLIHRGIPFQIKNFAIGMRAEHPQELINKAQWGVSRLPGIKAAEYRLTSSDETKNPVYSFCMCPGGIVVPATAYKHTNIVNGMSVYLRNNFWANAAVVAGINPLEILGENATPLQTLDWLENLEQSFYSFSNSYKAPAVRIDDFLKDKTTLKLPQSSYPFGLIQADFTNLLPPKIIETLKSGLKNFTNKLYGYDQGVLIGLESKTSSPIQVVRDKENFSAGYENFFIAGEGSGWAGGIVSSAADGIKIALSILKNSK